MATKRLSLRDRNKAAIALPEADFVDAPAPESTEPVAAPEPAPDASPSGDAQLEGADQSPTEVVPAAPAQEPARVAAPASPPSRRSGPKRQAARASSPAAAPAAASTDRGRFGIYFRSQPDEFNDARAAYLADWSRGGNASTFAEWVAGALEEHADRTPAERARLARDLGDGVTGGSTRSFVVPEAVSARVRGAISKDNSHGRWPSASSWAGDAIAVAVDRAREAAGGHLPTPPARLPKRLTR